MIQHVRLLNEGGTSLEAVRDDVAIALEDPGFFGDEILYSHLHKDTLVVADSHDITMIDLQEGKSYDHIVARSDNLGSGRVQHITVITYDYSTKQVFGGMLDGTIKCWRDARAKVKVGGYDPRYLTSARPCIVLKGHQAQITALLFCSELTDADQRLVSGSADSNIVIWKKVYSNGVVYRKEHVLSGHNDEVLHLFSEQNLLVSTDKCTIKIWHMLSGECKHTLSVREEEEGPCKPISAVSVCSSFVSCVVGDAVRVWSIVSGACVSHFRPDIPLTETVRGALLKNNIIFVVSATKRVPEIRVSVCNFVSAECVKSWESTAYPLILQLEPDACFDVQLIGGQSPKLIASLTLPSNRYYRIQADLDPAYYFVFRPAPPQRRRGQGFKRKRENFKA